MAPLVVLIFVEVVVAMVVKLRWEAGLKNVLVGFYTAKSDITFCLMVNIYRSIVSDSERYSIFIVSAFLSKVFSQQCCTSSSPSVVRIQMKGSVIVSTRV